MAGLKHLTSSAGDDRLLRQVADYTIAETFPQS